MIRSSWSVKDDSTGKLMTAYHGDLWWGGLAKLEALRAAQFELLERNRMRDDRGLPSTWGPSYSRAIRAERGPADPGGTFTQELRRLS